MVEKWIVIEIAEDPFTGELSFPKTYLFNDRDAAVRFAEKRSLEEAYNSGKKIHCFAQKLEFVERRQL